MKTRLLFIIALLTLLILAVSLSSCAPVSNIPEDLDLSGISLSGEEVYYDGGEHSLLVSGTLPEGVSVVYEGNSKVEVGTYTITAKFYYNGEYVSGKDISATLKIKPLSELSLSGVAMVDKETTYNGKPHSILVTGTLPEGVSVEYVGNDRVDACPDGAPVTAKFYYKGIYLDGRDMSATLKIARLTIDLYHLSFNDTTIVFDGYTHSIAVEGEIPEFVTVEYEGNGVIDVGEHTVTARFVANDNCILTEDELTATVTIIMLSADMAGLEFADGEVEYNGEAHSLALSGLDSLPVAITFIGYEGNGVIDVGEHTVKAKFALNGVYNPNLDLTATLTIKPAKIGVTAPDADFSFAFDGEKKSPDALVWESGKPSFVTVLVSGAGERLPGVYTVTYSFVIDDDVKSNYLEIEDITVTMTIVDNPELATDGIIYGERSDGTYYVEGYNGDATALIIPPTYNGAAVTAIKYGAFDGNTNLEYVRVPASVKAIGQAAFRGCTSLEAITLPFVGGSHNSSNEYFGFIFGASGYVGNAQFVPASLKMVELVGCERVPAYSFFGCESIEKVIIGEGATEVGVSAFRGCVSLTAVYLPESLTTIQCYEPVNSAFLGCSTELTVYIDAATVPAGFEDGWGAIDTEGAFVKVETK